MRFRRVVDSSDSRRAGAVADVEIVRGQAGYPAGLLRLAEPPPRLRVRGKLPSLARAVAIVGTRSASERGIRLATDLAGSLARAGCVVVSGGARGIDRAAHLGALEAGGATLVVCASGLARPYPAEHASLFEEIVARGGALVSERADDAWPAPRHFLARNRLIAALAEVVVVVEAPARSGALSTAAHARALGVPLFAVPRVPETNESRGSNDLLRAGARACLSVADVLGALEGPGIVWGAAPPLPARLEPKRAPVGTLPSSARALAAIEAGARDLDALVEATGLSAADAAACVAELEVLGLVSQRPDGTLESLG